MFKTLVVASAAALAVNARHRGFTRQDNFAKINRCNANARFATCVMQNSKDKVVDGVTGITGTLKLIEYEDDNSRIRL